MFTSRFITSSRKRKTIDILIDSRQKPGESLKNYADRYYDLYNTVEGCDSSTAATSFKKGLISSPQFVQELMRRPPRDMSHLMRIVGREVDLEEYLDNPFPAPPSAEGKHPAREGKKQVNQINKKEGKRKDNTDFSLANVTYFTQPLHRVLKECGRMRGFEWPEAKMGTAAGVKPDSKIYCSYHDEKGHFTNSCQPLKDHLERLVREGKMETWIDKERTPTTHRDPPAGVVHCIHGPVNPKQASFLRQELSSDIWTHEVFASESSSKRKRGDTADTCVISFSDQDFGATKLPHSDALVIEAHVGPMIVRRILID